MITHIWHHQLGMTKHDLAWHEADMADELQELSTSHGIIHTWSEKSDVVYTYTRAKWSGHRDIAFPLLKKDYFIGWLYMIPKYSGRWLFFHQAGKKLGANVRAVRNPKKVHKLHEIAEKHGVDPIAFEEICTKQLRYWRYLLLK